MSKLDPYASFLPPAIPVDSNSDEYVYRAVVFVTEDTRKGTARSHQEYDKPLLTLSGQEYEAMPFPILHERICDALRGDRPRVVMEIIGPDGSNRVIHEGDLP